MGKAKNRARTKGDRSAGPARAALERAPRGAAENQAARAAELVTRMEREVQRGTPLDAAYGQHLRNHRELGGRERRFLSELVFAHFRWKGWTAPIGLWGLEGAAAAGYLLSSDRTHPVAAAMLASCRLPGAGLAPQAGRPLAERGAALCALWRGRIPENLAPAELQPEALAPAWLTEVLHTPAGEDGAAHRRRCLEAFQERPPTWLAVRPGYREALEALLGPGARLRSHPRLDRALALSGNPDLAPARRKLPGFFQVQDLASQAVCEACAPGPGERWWDACAGAGGKALGLLERMQGRGRVLATDLRRGILESARRRAEEAGLAGLEFAQLDSSREDPPRDETDRQAGFDGVLVDAPCSGLGTWARNPDARWRIAREEIERLAGLQARILERVSARVRPGGALVYSVCTLTEAEGPEVVRRFLGRAADFALEPFAHPLSGEPTDGAAWVWPWDGPGNGMYLARLRRER
jgi:16S rRNA (cytosine967-C5)-methyltransferase